MKLVEIAGVCFDAEGVDAFYSCTEDIAENVTFDNNHGVELEGSYSDWTVVSVGNVKVIVHADYASVKVAMQMALRQTIGD